MGTSGSHTVRLRSGDLVRIRPVRPDDAPALARAYANLGEQSRFRRFFTLMPELPQHVLKAATDVDHTDHEALVALPLLSGEIIGECRFVRDAHRHDTADVAVTVVDSWQGRGVATALLRELSGRALELGVDYYTADVLAENRAVLAMLPRLGRVRTEQEGGVVSARVEIVGQEAEQVRPDLIDLVRAVAGGEIVSLPMPLRGLVRASGEIAETLLLPVATLLAALGLRERSDLPSPLPAGRQAATGTADQTRPPVPPA